MGAEKIISRVLAPSRGHGWWHFATLIKRYWNGKLKPAPTKEKKSKLTPTSANCLRIKISMWSPLRRRTIGMRLEPFGRFKPGRMFTLKNQCRTTFGRAVRLSRQLAPMAASSKPEPSRAQALESRKDKLDS